MNYSIILKIIGWVLQLEGLFFLLPAITGFLYGETTDALIYLGLGMLCVLFGACYASAKGSAPPFMQRRASLPWH